MPRPCDRVLELWFGELDEQGCSSNHHTSKWWSSSPDHDQMLRRELGHVHAEIVAGGHRDWVDEPLGRLAYIIVCDQLSRNLFREQPAMYALDDRALEATHAGRRVEHDLALDLDHRCFFYMPLMHSERIADQRLSVELFEQLTSEQTGRARERSTGNLRAARHHLAIVERFGRFPHRNAILGRDSTPAELDFLAQPGSSF